VNLGELTEKDCELLMQALDAWEKAPSADAMASTVVDIFLSRGGSQDESERRAKKTGEDAERAILSRKAVTILLRAKIELIRQEAQRAAIAAAKSTEAGT